MAEIKCFFCNGNVAESDLEFSDPEYPMCGYCLDGGVSEPERTVCQECKEEVPAEEIQYMYGGKCMYCLDDCVKWIVDESTIGYADSYGC